MADIIHWNLLHLKMPVITGKHTFNFPEIFRMLVEVQGVLEVNSTADALERAVEALLNSKRRVNV